jgi:hypothetical protein
MTTFLITSIVFFCCICGILLGNFIRGLLPAHHLSQESKDVVKLSTGLIATLTALILGLLVASANSSYQSFNNGMDNKVANLLTMDRAMAYFGSEAQPTRDALRQYIATVLVNNWPEDRNQVIAKLTPGELASLPSASESGHFTLDVAVALKEANSLSNIQEMLLRLEPKNDAQRWRQTRALEMSGRLAEKRWLLVQQAQNSLPTPFLVVLVIWLVILFVTFSVLAPGNKTVATGLLLCALSVSGSVFLILELSKPTMGLFKIPSTSLIQALEIVGR